MEAITLDFGFLSDEARLLKHIKLILAKKAKLPDEYEENDDNNEIVSRINSTSIMTFNRLLDEEEDEDGEIFIRYTDEVEFYIRYSAEFGQDWHNGKVIYVSKFADDVEPATILSSIVEHLNKFPNLEKVTLCSNCQESCVGRYCERCELLICKNPHDEPCPICLTGDIEIWCKTKCCGKIFHRHCLNESLIKSNRRCPCCRQGIISIFTL